MAKRYTVSDGKLTLVLEAAEEGGYIVTSPLDSELITEADTVEEAFVMARDALSSLRASRAKTLKDFRRALRQRPVAERRASA
jgi:hypothetical protein